MTKKPKLSGKTYRDPEKNLKILWDFVSLYYNVVPRNQTFFGVTIQKCPLDLWVYHEILYETNPDFIIETGTLEGGSALYLAIICDILNHGQVISIDNVPGKNLPKHPRIQYLTGSSTDPKIIKEIKNIIGEKRVMVILDSDHTEEHVSKELRLYSPLVARGNYLIIEDTNISLVSAAVRKFMSKNKGFITDSQRQKFLMTFNPGGYLKKVW